MLDLLAEDPRHDGRSGGQMGGEQRRTRLAVGGQGRTGIEAEPTDPQHRRPDGGQHQIVRLHRHLGVTLALADDQCCDQAGDAGIDVHHGAAGEVEDVPIPEQRAIARPRHVADRQVDDREPDRGEQHHRPEAHAFGKGSDDQRRRDDGEGELEQHEDQGRNRPGHALRRNARQADMSEATDEGAHRHHAGLHAGRVEGQTVAVDDPQDRHQGGDPKAGHQHREHVLGPHQAPVEQGQAGQSHEQHQSAGHDHPGGVAGIDGGEGRSSRLRRRYRSRFGNCGGGRLFGSKGAATHSYQQGQTQTNRTHERSRGRG